MSDSELTAKKHAILVARKIRPSVVHEFGYLEKNPHTYPQVQSLLQGVSIGGHKLTDQRQLLRIATSWDLLVDSVEDATFVLSKNYTMKLHSVLAENEARNWGTFRDSNIEIGDVNYTPPHFQELDAHFEEMLDRANSLNNPLERAITVFLDFARKQFFYDCNKRIGMLIMNGILLENSQHIITVPIAYRDQYIEHLVRFYERNDDFPLRSFLEGCQFIDAGNGVVRRMNANSAR